ncbi:unnamed protein product [Anisakis simplex]|uniref:Gelsolin-like protein 1 (inferred by orthology to a C. elegans protein) n=1 Tax=Anisakis simplex TaxID=6269 RepID=A0A0M3KEA1_ANISI|nr:unnamed protein product [Anisakis simplex]
MQNLFRNVKVACEHDSLNLGDVFILDCELDLYVWMPPESGRLERIKGMSQAKSIRDEERNGKPKVHVLDLDWNKNDAFWKIMGGKQNVSKLKSAEAGGADENFWRTNKQQITLWRCWAVLFIALNGPSEKETYNGVLSVERIRCICNM